MDENRNQGIEDEFLSRTSNKKIISLVVGALISIFLVIALIAFALSFFTKSPSGKATLTYWGAWEDASVFEEVIGEFNKSHPDIIIKYEKQDIKSLGNYITRLSTRAENDTGPDLFRFHSSWITQLKPLLLPLPEDVVKSSEIDSKYYNAIKKDLKVNGAYYGIPIQFDTLSLFVNKKIFENAGIKSYPKTWDELIKVARELTVKNEEGKIQTSGVALGTADNVAHATDIVSLLFLQNGAEIKDLNGKTKNNSVDAIDYYTSFANGDAKVWDEALDNSTLAFAKGNLAMYFGYSWDIFQIQALNPDLDFEVITVPSLPDRDITVASYWVEGVSSKSKHPKEAFEFLKFLTRKDNMEKIYAKQAKVRLFGEFYPRSDMGESLSTNPLIEAFVKQSGSARSTIFSSDTYDDAMIASLNSYLLDAVRSINKDGTSPQSAIETLAQGVDQVYARYESSK